MQAGIVDIAGLAHSMAGVNYTDKGPFGGVGGANLIIRGLNSETTSGLPACASPVVPPVATYVDDTPLVGQSSIAGSGPGGSAPRARRVRCTARAPSAVPFDSCRTRPIRSEFDAKVEAGVSKTNHTHALNEDVKGMLNLPLSDTFAVRLNAGWTDEAGFINQPNLYKLDSTGVPVSATPGALFSDPVVYDKDGVNSYQYRSARVAALFKPSEEFHAQLSYYHQLSNANGFPYVATSLAGYNQPVTPSVLPVGNFTNPPVVSQYYNGPVPAGVDRLSSPENMASTTHDTVDMAALTLEYDMGFATLTSATSWAHHVNHTSADETAEYENFFGFPQDLYGQNPRMFIVGKEAFDDKPWSQELRLASKSGGKLEWVGGLFFKNQTTAIKEDDYYPGYYDFYNACAPIYGPSPADFDTPSYCGVGDTAYVPGQTTVINGVTVNKDEAFVGDFNTKFKEIALFGELTGHVTSAWSVTGGARVFKQTLTQTQANRPALLGARRNSDLRPPTYVRRLVAPCAVEVQYLLSIRQGQFSVRDVVARLPARQRERIAVHRRRFYRPFGTLQGGTGHGRQLRGRHQGHRRESLSLLRRHLRHPMAQGPGRGAVDRAGTARRAQRRRSLQPRPRNGTRCGVELAYHRASGLHL